MLTVGVEEEFLLLDGAGAVAPVAPDVLRRVGADQRIKPELMTYQIEITSSVSTGLTGLAAELTRLRQRVAEAAARAGAHLVASGVPPFGDDGLTLLTDTPRYRELAARFPGAAAASGTCGCHVHVGFPDRDLAAQVVGRLRPWLPTLLALTVNSPFAGGQDSGWSSNRYRRQLQWPTFRPPGAWRSAARHDRAVAALVAAGAALDQHGVYFLARLSQRYPTIEVRIADTCLQARDAALLAGVVRGLVGTLAADVRATRPAAALSGSALRAQLLAVAHHGVPIGIVRPRGTPGVRSVEPLVDALLERIRPALEETDDLEYVLAGLARLLADGTGADRQRRLRAAPTPAMFVSALARTAVPPAVTAGTAGAHDQ